MTRSTTDFAPGSVIQARRRLWRVDARRDEVLTATAIDGQTEQIQLYLPFEAVRPGALPLPSPERVGVYQARQLLLRAYRLSLLHGTAPLLSLQRSEKSPATRPRGFLRCRRLGMTWESLFFKGELNDTEKNC